MLESVICPSCSTRYGLRPERIHIGIRRACCFKCGSCFPIEINVSKLLEKDEAPLSLAAPTSQFFEPEAAPLPPLYVEPEQPLDLQADAVIPPRVPSESIQALMDANPIQTMDGIKAEDLLELDIALPEAPDMLGMDTLDALDTPRAMPEAEAIQPEADHQKATQELDLSNVPEIDEASLMLGDLDDSILETQPIPRQPSVPANGTYSSAKDAISKLLGTAIDTPTHERRGSPRNTGPMDVEATLDALENTLGGVNLKELNPPPPIPSLDPHATSNHLGTIKLSAEDIQQAMAAVNPQQEPVPQPSNLPPAPQSAPSTPSEEQLKVQLDGETLQNLGLSQIIRMIEDGKVQDWHLVARQYSENWIEAGKIPSLRTTFDRIRKSGQQESSIEIHPPKKGLFGGLFGRG